MGISKWTLFSDFTRYFHFLYEEHDRSSWRKIEPVDKSDVVNTFKQANSQRKKVKNFHKLFTWSKKLIIIHELFYIIWR